MKIGFKFKTLKNKVGIVLKISTNIPTLVFATCLFIMPAQNENIAQKDGVEVFDLLRNKNQVSLENNLNQYDKETYLLLTLLSKFKRPFTIFDFSANPRFVQNTIKYGRLFDYTYVIFGMEIDSFPKNSVSLVVLNDIPSPSDFDILSNCENPDIVIIDCEHFDIKAYNLQNIINLGMITIFLKPSSVLKTVLLNQDKEHNSSNLLEITDEFLVVYKMQKKLKLNAFHYSPSASWTKNYTIASSFKEKYFFKEQRKIIWAKGINLYTYLNFNPKYPTKNTIENAIYKNFTLSHSDYMPNNLIVQGGDILPIDNDGRFCTISQMFKILNTTLYWLYNAKKGLDVNSITLKNPPLVIKKNKLALELQHLFEKELLGLSLKEERI